MSVESKVTAERFVEAGDQIVQIVNGDGLLDLVCHFQTRSTGFQSGDTLGILIGKTFLRLADISILPQFLSMQS